MCANGLNDSDSPPQLPAAHLNGWHDESRAKASQMIIAAAIDLPYNPRQYYYHTHYGIFV